MSQARTCTQCGTAIVGRSDKRYCSDPCRHLANNVIKQQNQHERRILQINAALRKNRSILKQHSPLGKTTLPRQYLELAGFDFRYLTQLYRTQKGNTYHLCYDYGYLLLPDEKVLIVNWQPYMDEQG
jgi:predicted nucleic acid-binding Zn ribbon protein